ncbi:hypothetical protein AO242_15475 [Pseudomonas sp. ICMP 561]|nr:hypothetical protein AO242_15475 [Pseudomonas sp. ICMP 561]
MITVIGVRKNLTRTARLPQEKVIAWQSNASPRRLTSEDAIAQPAHNSVGAGLARDKDNSIHLQHRGVCIAGKPGSHRRKQFPVEAVLPATIIL